MPDSSRVVLLHKPAGISSFQALGPLKKRLGTKKVGHAGTLDPFAEGLLIGLCGRTTKLAPYFSGLNKRYRVRMRFGTGTNTLDPEGITDCTGPVPGREEIEKSIAAHTGAIDQVPPGFSAVRVAGKRAYRLARRGESVSLEARRVRIDKIELETYTPPTALMDIQCSKGTYIRAIARDIAASIGTCAYVEWLERTEIGPFTLAEIEGDRCELSAAEALGRLSSIPLVRAIGNTALRIPNGGKIDPAELKPSPGENGVFGVLDENDELLAVIEHNEGRCRYQSVLVGND